MTIKLPEVIHLGPMPFDLISVVDLQTKEDDGTETRLNGHILYHNLQIKVEFSLPDKVKAAVVWHEVIHGLLYQMGYTDHSEEMVQALGYAVFGVIRANPELVKMTQQA